MTPEEATERVATLRRVIESELDGASECMVPITATPELVEALAEVERLSAELEREREDRTREYEFYGADTATYAERIRGLIAENEALRSDVDKTIKAAVRNASDAQRRVGELAKQDQRMAQLEEIVRAVADAYVDDPDVLLELIRKARTFLGMEG